MVALELRSRRVADQTGRGLGAAHVHEPTRPKRPTRLTLRHSWAPYKSPGPGEMRKQQDELFQTLRKAYLLVLADAHSRDGTDQEREENQVLKGQMKGHRPRPTDEHPHSSAAKGRRIATRPLSPGATIVTPDTIPRWHRQLIARKWTFEPKRPGRPGLRHAISSLIADGHGESGLGLQAHPGSAEEPGLQRGQEYDRKGAEGRGTVAGPGPADHPGGRSCGLTGARSREPTSSPARSGRLGG